MAAQVPRQRDALDDKLDKLLGFIPPTPPRQTELENPRMVTDSEASEAEDPDQEFADAPPMTPSAGGETRPKELPPPSPALSEVSNLSISEVKKRQGKLWKKIVPISINEHSGEILRDTGSVVFKVPAAAPKPYVNGNETNRFGEPFTSRINLVSHVPIEKLEGRSLQNRISKMLQVVRADEEAGKNLSDTVVKLYVAYATRVPAEGTRVVKEGTRLSTIPVLPPFEAFSKPTAVRSELLKPSGDPSRSFPLSVLSIYKTIDPKKYHRDLAAPWISGLDHVREFLNDKIAAQFTVRSVMTLPSMHLHLQIDAMTIHRFNCNAKELIDLSGALSGPDQPLPSITKHFSMGLVKPDSFADARTVRVPSLTTAEERLMLEQMIKSLLDMDLPPRNVGLSNHSATIWAPFNDEILDHLMKFVISQNLPLMGLMKSVSKTPSMEAVRQNFLAYYRGYLLWRYYYLPDQVIACCAMDYIALHPRMDPTHVYMLCPAGGSRERLHGTFNKRVTAFPAEQDPSRCLLFAFFHDSFDDYGASLFLYKLICDRKQYLLKLREDYREEKKSGQKPSFPAFRQSSLGLKERKKKKRSKDEEEEEVEQDQNSDEDSEERPKDACNGTAKGFTRTFSIRGKRAVSILEVLGDLDPTYNGGRTADTKLDALTDATRRLMNDMVAAALEGMNELYTWRRYPGLCSTYVGKRSRVAKLRWGSKDETDDAGEEQTTPQGEIFGQPAAASSSEPSKKKSRKDAPSQTTTDDTPKPAKTELPKEGPVFDAILYKSMRLGRVVVTLSRDRVPDSMKADFERALTLFNSSFKIVGEKRATELGRHAYKDHPRSKMAADIIYYFMKEKNLFENPRNIPEVKFIEAFLLGNRAECPDLVVYPIRQSQVIFDFVKDTEVHKWYLETRRAYEDDKRKRQERIEERRRKREEKKINGAGGGGDSTKSSGQDSDSSLSLPENLLSEGDNPSDEELLSE